MRLSLLRRSSPVEGPEPRGVARLDKRTKDLTKRLKPGEVAVIDHLDIDRIAAEGLLACSPAAVVNCAASISGRYPNLGPEILVEAGIPVLDAVGPDVFGRLDDGDQVVLDGDRLLHNGEVVAQGSLLDIESLKQAMDEARAGLAVQLEAFASNTMEYLRQERDLLIDGIGVPDINTVIDGRHVLIVVRGYHYKEDLQTLRPYIREHRPVLIGVDGGADALIELGYNPDLIVGDMDSVSDEALGAGAEVVVHAYRDGRAPGLERVESLGVDPIVFPATGTSEDVAMLLADDKGASLIVAVGTHVTLVEFLDKGRAGMASTFLTRLRVGGKLIDAKGVSRLYRSRISTGQLLLLILAGLAALMAAMSSTVAGRSFFDLLGSWWHDLVFWVTG
ncbi:MAG: putative cytokinetic ring protein SteA [Actinomycetes bacterium]